MEIKNIRKYETLNINPKVVYAEADYIGATEWQKKYGYIKKEGNETIVILSADIEERLKEIFKKSMLDNILNPKQYIITVVKEGVVNE